jgi:hypothetical protein
MMRGAGDLAHMGELKNSYIILCWKNLKGKDHLRNMYVGK